MVTANAVSAPLRLARFVVHPTLDAFIEFLDAVNSLPAVSDPPLAALRRREQCWRAFSKRPRVGAIDMDALGALPPGTLGYEFVRHMRANDLDPAAIPTRPGDTDAR